MQHSTNLGHHRLSIGGKMGQKQSSGLLVGRWSTLWSNAFWTAIPVQLFRYRKVELVNLEEHPAIAFRWPDWIWTSTFVLWEHLLYINHRTFKGINAQDSFKYLKLRYQRSHPHQHAFGFAKISEMSKGTAVRVTSTTGFLAAAATWTSWRLEFGGLDPRGLEATKRKHTAWVCLKLCCWDTITKVNFFTPYEERRFWETCSSAIST